MFQLSHLDIGRDGGTTLNQRPDQHRRYPSEQWAVQCRVNRDTCTLRASLLNEGRRKEPLKFTWLNRAQHPLQPLSNFISNQPDLGFVDQLEHGIGVHELDVDAARNILAHHHIAGQ